MGLSTTDKKKIQRNRMLAYFTSAAIEIINEDGLPALTIRKVADKAGYNSATLYHYFSNLSHLTLFASVHYLKDYAMDLATELPRITSPIEAYLKVWECFCRRSYEQPAVYEMLFFHAYKELDLNEVFQTYYKVFPDEINADILEYSAMLTEANIFKREFIALTKTLISVKKKIPEQDVRRICEMNILIYRGMLSSINQEGPLILSLEEAVSHTVEYMKNSLTTHGIDFSS